MIFKSQSYVKNTMLRYYPIVLIASVMIHNILYLRKEKTETKSDFVYKIYRHTIVTPLSGRRSPCMLVRRERLLHWTHRHTLPWCTDSKARSVKEIISLRRAYGLSLQVIDIGPIVCGRSINYILRALLRHLSYLTRGYCMIHSFMIAESASGTD